ncbi:Peptidoglycan-binding (PGRP) domain of peptidoglycan hydrolases-containing protein [Amycolatopsis arida]|uniref:Peptidoglycan-binding (PGRP) domain of peptidoglycan hydrolases-containing protein n=1 Tax=Amycolatopsis arida TaxID=587909 RepID=A0A1I5SJA5_9PSEU|nr:peptidoglycan-binding protein [Amycolatopsis arida]TDX96459.1 peptidoglycan hydrolase-like protein with peptidoglycan-binding domain [Amycolatopsis arida]SFP70840.1 Peptidoglycan-binding (PGRP) domain of peptidoglycan hydrolases-containing protein [Amycolatopsis arida]
MRVSVRSSLVASAALAVLVAMPTAATATTATSGAATATIETSQDQAQTAGHPTTNLKLTRADILKRSKSWIDERVPYSQSSFHTNQYGRYRQDCSGFVSMSWGLRDSRWTGNLMEVATRISKADLLPGDALFLHQSGGTQHVALFVRWADSAKTQAVVREQYRTGTVASERTWSASRTSRFQAIRYKNVIEGDARTCAVVNENHLRYPKLDQGATGELVKAAQCLLTSAGFNTGADGPSGTFDETTANATKQFQVKVGLPASGSVDSRTWTALLSRGGTPQVQDGSSGDAVVRVQRSLNAAVGAGLNVDGLFGPKTTAAVKQYQSSRGLAADGIVGPNTWKALQAGK